MSGHLSTYKACEAIGLLKDGICPSCRRQLNDLTEYGLAPRRWCPYCNFDLASAKPNRTNGEEVGDSP